MTKITDINQIYDHGRYYIERGELEPVEITFKMVVNMKLIDLIDLISEERLLLQINL